MIKLGRLMAAVALTGLSACTVYPNGTVIMHSPPPRPIYVVPAPVYVPPPPVYVVPRPYYYTTPYAPWRTNPYQYNYHHRHHRPW